MLWELWAFLRRPGGGWDGSVRRTHFYCQLYASRFRVSPSEVTWFLMEDPGKLVAAQQELGGGGSRWLRDRLCRQTDLGLSFRSRLCDLGRLSDVCELEFVMGVTVTLLIRAVLPRGTSFHNGNGYLTVRYSSSQPLYVLSPGNVATVTKDLSLH